MTSTVDQQFLDLADRGPPRAVRADRARRRPVADEVHAAGRRGARAVHPDAAAGSRAACSGARWSIAGAETGRPEDDVGVDSRPSSHSTPSGVIRSNIGRRSSTPAARAPRRPASTASPVTLTTLSRRQPGRTRSSTRATAARPFSLNGPSRNTADAGSPTWSRGVRGDLHQIAARPTPRRPPRPPAARRTPRARGTPRCATAARGRSPDPGSAARTAGPTCRSR